MSLEVELKLAIPPEQARRFRRLVQLGGVRPVSRRLYGIYFDTPDFDLYRRHAAFRVRREGYRWVQTLKLEAGSAGGLSTRPEWETTVTGNRPDPAVLPEEARAILGDGLLARLRPVFNTDFRRTTWRLELPAGSVEVALDLGRVQAGDAELPIAEVELELLSGEGAVLFGLALSLLESVRLVPEFRSKAQRGYLLAGIGKAGPAKAAEAGIEAHLPAAEAWRRMLLAGLTQLGRNLPGFLDGGDPEYLHQMRVAVRRMRTVLNLGRALGETVAAWADELRWFMDELSPARDWDVMVTETLAGVRAGLPDPDRLDALLAAARRRREKHNDRARIAAGGQRLVALMLDMGKGLLADRQGKVVVRDWAAAALDKRLRRFRRLAKSLDARDTAGLHQLRIAAKRLRYAGEAFAPLYGGKADRYIEALGRLQDVLGAANDLAVAHRLLAELAVGGRLAGAAGFVEGYLARAPKAGGRRIRVAVSRVLDARPFWRQA